ncbi:hypothetical protein SISSUDRAFT_1118749 [Sistotremastrum suecicum HHB10207 ss-3]|uniref:MYND-type domain-containing protein n=1 Tax=Sistotremastrum suecicum HHB10207 ss-3 TaxID=1314776 RepID=A0A166EPW2_9AGAM|nr:hypothetical protein SISSUDRAFT_1118749 [Sistotremastrum suecicum HHB10207 ss-3]
MGRRENRMQSRNGRQKLTCVTCPNCHKTPFNALTQELLEVNSWEKSADIICRRLKIDLSDRTAFKELHKNFSYTLFQLSKCWNENKGNVLVIGGILVIFGRIAPDVLLRDKMLNSGPTFVSKIVMSLSHPTTRGLALETLHTASHHGGPHIPDLLAVETLPAIVRVLESSLDPPADWVDDGVEQCLPIICHMFTSLFRTASWCPTSPSRLEQLRVHKILPLALDRIRAKGLNITWNELIHGVTMITELPSVARDLFHQHPNAIRLMAACLRSPSIAFRGQGVLGVYRLEDIDRHKKTARHSEITFAVMERAITQTPPQKIQEALSSYGAEDCHIEVKLKAYEDMLCATEQCTTDGDLLVYGRSLAEIIPRAGSLHFCGVLDSTDASQPKLVPFSDWRESLHHAALALRAENELDAADIVELHYLRAHGPSKLDALGDLARAAISRNPTIPFFYYVLNRTHGTQSIDAVRKGLECENNQGIIYYELLFSRGSFALARAITELENAVMDPARLEQGVAYLRCAHEDMKVYIEGAPPDATDMLSALDQFIILSIVLNGPKFSPDLPEITVKSFLYLCKDILEKYKLAEEIHAFFFENSAPITLMNCVRTTIMRELPKAAKEWDIFIERTSDISPWLANLQQKALTETLAIDSEELQSMAKKDVPREHSEASTVRGTNNREIKLYKCSWCHSSTAVMRKCSRCGKARYCDANCQKYHWSVHKAECTSPEIEL